MTNLSLRLGDSKESTRSACRPSIPKGNGETMRLSSTFQILSGLQVSVGSSVEWDLVTKANSNLAEERRSH